MKRNTDRTGFFVLVVAFVMFGALGNLYFFERVEISDFNPERLEGISGEVIAKDRLKGYWKFDGDFLNEFGSEKDSSCSNCPGFVPGREGYGEALEFNGATSVDLGNSTFEVHHDISITFWFYVFNGSNLEKMNILSRGNYYPYGLGIKEEGFLDTGIRIEEGVNYLSLRAAAKSGKWHHAALTVDANKKRKVYFDGVHRESSTLNGTLQHGAGRQIILGAALNDYSSFKGLIDDLRIYNTALKGQEIQQIYNGDLEVFVESEVEVEEEKVEEVQEEELEETREGSGSAVVSLKEVDEENLEEEKTEEEFSLEETNGDSEEDEGWIETFIWVLGIVTVLGIILWILY